MQKTGSTAIQRSLAQSNGAGFILPHLGGHVTKPLHRDALVKLFSSKSEELASWYKRKGHDLDVVRNPEETIRQAASTSSTVILSSEASLKILSKSDLERFAEFAHTLFDQIEVVGYVREPVSWISSAFWTHVKGYPATDFPLSRARYHRFKVLDKVFGRENVKLWKFDRKEFPAGDVVRHFCSQLGLPQLESRIANETISLPAVAAIYRLNRGMRSNELEVFQRVRTPIIRSFAGQQWPKFRLSPDLIRPQIDLESLDWIERRIGHSLRDGQVKQENDVSSEADLLRLGLDALRDLKRSPLALAPDELAMVERQFT
jgi:hypothetical protein